MSCELYPPSDSSEELAIKEGHVKSILSELVFNKIRVIFLQSLELNYREMVISALFMFCLFGLWARISDLTESPRLLLLI